MGKPKTYRYRIDPAAAAPPPPASAPCEPEDAPSGLTVGDLLEWLAALALAVAGFLAGGWPLALLVAGVALAYFAQCY